MDLNSDNNSLTQVCLCGRTFYNQGSYTYHARGCQKTKKRVSRALVKAKEIWQSRKRRRLEASEQAQNTPELSGGAVNTEVC